MAIDTIISNDELVVVGPPDSVSVSVDIGPQGERGSQFYYGVGAPEQNQAIVEGARLKDLYINQSSSGTKYGTVYMLNAVTGGTVWQEVLRFQPLAYSLKKIVNFIAGSGSISIPLSDFYSSAPENLNANTILVQATAELNNPAFVSISSKNIQTISGSRNFVAELKGAQLSSGSVSLLSSSAVPISFYITAGSGE